MQTNSCVEKAKWNWKQVTVGVFSAVALLLVPVLALAGLGLQALPLQAGDDPAVSGLPLFDAPAATVAAAAVPENQNVVALLEEQPVAGEDESIGDEKDVVTLDNWEDTAAFIENRGNLFPSRRLAGIGVPTNQLIAIGQKFFLSPGRVGQRFVLIRVVGRFARVFIIFNITAGNISPFA